MDIGQAIRLFRATDRNNDGVISKEEMKAAMYHHMPGLNPENMTNIFRVVDDNNSGFVNRYSTACTMHYTEHQHPMLQVQYSMHYTLYIYTQY
jgi:Ca2+-binding EF-hand superfamily protein